MIGMAERVDSLRPQLCCEGDKVAVLNLYGSGGCGVRLFSMHSARRDGCL